MTPASTADIDPLTFAELRFANLTRSKDIAPELDRVLTLQKLAALTTAGNDLARELAGAVIVADLIAMRQDPPIDLAGAVRARFNQISDSKIE